MGWNHPRWSFSRAVEPLWGDPHRQHVWAACTSLSRSQPEPLRQQRASRTDPGSTGPADERNVPSLHAGSRRLSPSFCSWHIFSVFFVRRQTLSVIFRSEAKLSLWAWKWPTCQWFAPVQRQKVGERVFTDIPGIIPASILMQTGKSSLICQFFFDFDFFPPMAARLQDHS